MIVEEIQCCGRAIEADSYARHLLETHGQELTPFEKFRVLVFTRQGLGNQGTSPSGFADQETLWEWHQHLTEKLNRTKAKLRDVEAERDALRAQLSAQ